MMEGLPKVRDLVTQGKMGRNEESKQRKIRAQQAKEARLRRAKVTDDEWVKKAKAAASKIRHDRVFSKPADRQVITDRERLASPEWWSNSLNKDEVFAALPTTLPVLWAKVKDMGITHKTKMIPLIKPVFSMLFFKIHHLVLDYCGSVICPN